ncbi:hypothetical protein XELAEV_18043903mg [Xenopus laevis]|uniref:Uncharacterized protein n=1 Tax=Xenopus laevis TaxID=8355 RepID=A0A974BY32_XENLA|nr:hypothetical protein XELAEV_18043903mg [Xenopus laevis]
MPIKVYGGQKFDGIFFFFLTRRYTSLWASFTGRNKTKKFARPYTTGNMHHPLLQQGVADINLPMGYKLQSNGTLGDLQSFIPLKIYCSKGRSRADRYNANPPKSPSPCLMLMTQSHFVA